jgi:hypothetical protein
MYLKSPVTRESSYKLAFLVHLFVFIYYAVLFIFFYRGNPAPLSNCNFSMVASAPFVTQVPQGAIYEVGGAFIPLLKLGVGKT